MVLKNVQLLTARLCEYGSLLQGKFKIANQLILKWGDHPRLPEWPNVITRVLKWRGKEMTIEHGQRDAMHQLKDAGREPRVKSAGGF